MRIRALCGHPPIYVYLRGFPRACEQLTANTSSTWVCTLRCPAPENVVFFTIPHINRIRLRRVFHAINTGVYYNTVRRTGVKYVYGTNTGEFDYELPPRAIFSFFFLFFVFFFVFPARYIRDFPSGTRGGYNQVTFIMKRSILWRITSRPSRQLHTRRCGMYSVCVYIVLYICVCVCVGNTTKSENDMKRRLGTWGWWVIGEWWWWRRGVATMVVWRAGGRARINRIWLLLSGGWWHVRAFVCNGSETVPLNKVYH